MLNKKFACSLLIAACFGLAFTVYYKAVQDAVTRDIMIYIQDVLKQSRLGVQRSVSDVFHTLGTVTAAVEKISGFNTETNMHFLKDVTRQNGFKRMGIVFPDGKIFTTDNTSFSILDRQYIQKAFAGKFNLSNIIEERAKGSAGQHINVYAAPVHMDGQVQAIIFATYGTDFLGDMLSVSMFDSRCMNFLIRRDGTLVAAQRDTAFAFYSSVLTGDAVQRTLTTAMSRDESGTVTFLDSDKTYLAAFDPVGADDLYVLSIVPDTVFDAQTANRMNLTAKLMLVLVFCTLLILWYVYHTSREIERERLHAREEAAASEAKSTFLSTMSHEIRTPLNAIVGFLHLISKLPLDQVQREYMRKANVSACSLVHIINDILDFSKIEARKMELENAPFPLSSLLDALQSIVGESARDKKLDLKVEVDADVPKTLVGDTTRLTQVLLNLLNNAVKFTEKGEVRLTVTQQEKSGDSIVLQFSVRDTGKGISPDMASRLFDPFVQATDSTRTQGGTGLGLAISRRLVNLMGGEIGLDSTPGQGSNFHFTVRLGFADDLPSALFGTASEETPRWDNKRVLVVEDNEINQEIIQEVLKSMGLVIDTAMNGEEAVRMAGATDYDLIFMDIQMPVMDGFEATRRLRALGAQPGSASPWLFKTTVVALTANATLEDRRRCMDAGMNDYLSKPLDFKALNACLSRWLS